MQKCLQLCTTNLDEKCYWLSFAAVLVCFCLSDFYMERGIKFCLCIQWMMHLIVEWLGPFLLACSVFLEYMSLFCPLTLLIAGLSKNFYALALLVLINLPEIRVYSTDGYTYTVPQSKGAKIKLS